MRYNSQVTPKGNSSYSFKSQTDADAKAAALDAAGCTDCTDCTDCSRCSRCSYCEGCSYCSRCSRCLRCSYCEGCSYCSRCSRCLRCSYCEGCSDDVIQAGRPNGWYCYGRLKDGALFIHCGCRRKTFAEAVEYWSNKPDRAEVLMACHYIASVARSRGWKV